MQHGEHVEMSRVDRRLPKVDTNGLTEQERRLVDMLSQETKEVLVQLHVPKLLRYKSRIIGFRSDDLLSLCESVHKGALQVSRRELQRSVMAKNGDHLYLSANPESSVLKKLRPETLGSAAPSTLFESISANRSAYGTMAVRQAIGRNILPLIPNVDRFLQDTAAETDDQFYDLSTVDGKATYLEEIIGALCGLNDEYVAAVAKHTGFSAHDLTTTLQSFQQREGIVLAIDERAATDLGLGTAQQTEGRNGEVVILSRNGEIPLEYVIGFETFGDFEDGIMERIES